MKKLNLTRWLLTALAAMTVFGASAVKKTFTAASLNVDGLPPTVKAGGLYTVKLNPEGPQSVGTKQISKLVSQKGWDFFAVSEAFNYNEDLMSEISGIYSTGTFRNKITDVPIGDVGGFLGGTKCFDTDGLNLLWSNASGITVKGEQWTLWSKRNGTTSDGADELIAKGFRYYCVTIATGMEVDVYIHHMDAETSAADNAAREIQMQQLVDAILASDNKRPIIIMGDTNCRYTRDRIKEIMFDQINADPRFTMHDPWIDFPRQGVYPSVGSGSIMVPRPYDGTDEGFQGFQTGEVVDKIWWIENKDSSCKLTALNYLHDVDFTWPDGSEISDHYPIVIDFEIEKLSEGVSDGEYYIRNNKLGKDGMHRFVSIGHDYGTRGIASRTGNRLTLIPAGENKFKIRTTLDKTSNYMGTASDGGVWMDWDDSYIYDFIRDPNTGFYTIMRDGKALSIDENENLVMQMPDSSNENQIWEIFGQQALLDNLRTYASESNPMDATFMLKGANFSVDDSDNDSWTKWRQSENVSSYGAIGGDVQNQNIEFYNPKFNRNGNSTWSIEQNLAGMPIGKYKVTFQGFYRDGDQNGTTNHAAAIIGGIRQDLYLINDATQASDVALFTPGDWQDDQKTNKNLYVPNCQSGASLYFNKGKYTKEFNVDVTNGSLPIKVLKESTTNASSWTVIDNFQITYLGPSAETQAAFDRVKAAIDDAQAKANNHNPPLTEYNNKAVVNAWESRLISGDGSKEVHNTYIALAKAATKQRKYPADLTYTILNNSFEMGSTVEWDVTNATGAQVVKGSISGSEGEYYLKADKGTISYTFEVTMPAGIYELSAMVNPGTVIEAGGVKSAPATGTAGQLAETKVRFLIKDGAATISATNSSALLADNFTLSRIADNKSAVAIDLIQIAMKDATAQVKTLNTYNEAEWNQKMAHYQTLIDNLDLANTDGTKEFREIYDHLRTYVFSQPTTGGAGVDYTKAIINPSFELDPTIAYGWDLDSQENDTGVKSTTTDPYTMNPHDKNNLFNTWNDGIGTAIQQEITNLPSGHYELSAIFASDAGKYVFMEVIPCVQAEGVPVTAQSQIFKLTDSGTTADGVTRTLSFDIADDGNDDTPGTTVIIRVGGCDGENRATADRGTWYKVDNFQLIRTGNHDLCYFYSRLKTAIEQADAIAGALPDKYSDTWDSSKYWDIIREHQLAPHDYENNGEINNEHDPLHGGNGIAEILELFGNLRSLVFSQTETDADMSGAIFNNSFELGDYTGWDIKAEAGDCGAFENVDPFTTEGIHGKYLFNVWNGDWAKPLTQTIPDMPSGRYKLTAKVASFIGNKFFLGANNKLSPIFEIPAESKGENGKGEFHEISLIFDVPVEIESKNVTIGLYPTTETTLTGTYNDEMGYYLVDQDSELIDPNTDGPWFKADQFRLELLSRYVDVEWKPEFADCGTIMLPFALNAQEYQQYLGQYGFKAYYIDHLAKNETPADIERNLYRIIKLSEPLTELEANKPYLLRKSETETVAVKSVKAVAPENGIYHIYGWSENKEDQALGEHEILEGSLVDYKPNTLHYHLQKDELGNIGFVLHDSTGEEPDEEDAISLDGYHALITVPITPEGFAETDGLMMQGYYFDEPVQEWKLVMEAGQYGTLVLPFEATLPAGLEAKQLIGVSEQRNGVGETYQVAQWTDKAVTTLEANVPYVVKNLSNSGKTEYTFKGVAENDVEEFSPEGNLLTGLFKSRDGVKYNDEKKRDLLEAGHWILMHDEETGLSAFVKTTNETELKAYNAYILNPEAIQTTSVKGVKLMAEETSVTPAADVIYLTDEDAKQTYEWEMKGPGYDAIILPFEADVPEGLEAYTLTGAENEQIWPKGTETYQVFEKTKADKLEANKAYLLVKAAAEENSGIDTQADDNVYTFTGTPNADASQANGLLKGTFDDITVNEDGAYLVGEEADKEFARIEDGRGEKVTALHAYIPADNVLTAQYLVLKDPKDEQTGVTEIMEGDVNVDIYTLDGVMVRRDVNAAEALQELDHGIYILRSAKGTVKVIK